MKQSFNLSTKTFTDEVKTYLRSAYNVVARPRLIVDWNLNRYTIPTADNTPTEDDAGFDIEAFPIESLYEPLRPNKGILKARVGEGIVSAGYQEENDAKFYIGSVDDIYKYWTSPTETDETGLFATPIQPFVSYPSVFQANKIMIKIENTWATPDLCSVQIQDAVGGVWTTVIDNPDINLSTGVITLWYDGTAWTTARPDILVQTPLAGVKFIVTSLKEGYDKLGNITTYHKRGETTIRNTSGHNSFLSLIAIEAHVEADLTDRVINVDDNFDMSESSQLYPVGTITTNEANVVLSNEDGLFNQDNVEGAFYGLLEPNAQFSLDYIFNIDGVDHIVNQFVMYNGPWQYGDGEVTLTLEDASKFLKVIKPRAAMYENMTGMQLVWRILDSVGFNDYKIQRSDTVVDHVIPVFWIDGEKTVWEILDEIAQATQTAIYVDQSGYIQVMSRDNAFKESETANWNLLGQTNGTDLADIISLEETNDAEANHISVVYRTTKWKTTTGGRPAMSQVWEPEGDTVVLRSTPLTRNIDDTAEFVNIDQKESRIWPFVGKVQIDAETIAYRGKRFVYYTIENGVKTKNYAIVNSEDEANKLHRKSPANLRKDNHYTGGLKIVEREVWNTTKRDHSVDVTGWTTKATVNGANRDNPRGFRHNKAESTVTIQTPSFMKNASDYFWSSRGTSSTNGYKAYGARIRFNRDASSTTQRAGIVFKQAGANEAGYYVELCLTNSLNSQSRKNRNEVMIYSRMSGKNIGLSTGSPMAIAPGIWYDLDVYISGDTQDNITVWLNGSMVASARTTNETKQADSGKMSMFARGKTNVSFEYIYGVTGANMKEPMDDYGFYDLKYGAARGDQWWREYVWETRTRWRRLNKKRHKKVREQYKYNIGLFDEFGPYVHEIREYDVKFDPSPVQSSYLFSTNEWYSVCVEYSSTPFGAKFIVANAGRDNAILKGQDNLLFGGTDKAVDQVFTILGRDLTINDEETVVRKNLSSIRSSGKIESELSSDWIQSKAMATDIAEWMTKHWSNGLDELTVTIFGNPLIEVADVVDIDYAYKDMTPVTHRYFVLAVQNSFDTGLETTLSLRRINTAGDSMIS